MACELLAPAGDWECLITAINAGADAIYLGLQDFNMRARAKNFQFKDLPKISKTCNHIAIEKFQIKCLDLCISDVIETCKRPECNVTFQPFYLLYREIDQPVKIADIFIHEMFIGQHLQ